MKHSIGPVGEYKLTLKTLKHVRIVCKTGAIEHKDNMNKTLYLRFDCEMYVVWIRCHVDQDNHILQSTSAS